MKDIPCLNDEQLLSGTKLCDAVKKHPCIYDTLSPAYQNKKVVDAAWRAIGIECIDTASNCRFRWKTVRSSFLRSYRRHGSKSTYYLYDHLIFLTPFLKLDKRDESTGQLEDFDTSLSDRSTPFSVASVSSEKKKRVNNEQDVEKEDPLTEKEDPLAQKADPLSGNDVEMSPVDEVVEEVKYMSAQNQDMASQAEVQCIEPIPFREYMEPLPINHCVESTGENSCEELPVHEISDEHSDTTSADESHKPKSQHENMVVPEHERTSRETRQFERASTETLQFESASQETQHSESTPKEARPTRTRKIPKRILEADTSLDFPEDKRPRRSLNRRKSVGGLVLQEYLQMEGLSTDNFDPDVVPNVNPVRINDNQKLHHKPELRTKLRVLKETCDVGVLARPIMMDNCTSTNNVHLFNTNNIKLSVEKGTQYDEVPKDRDDDFLDSLRPQIKTMNFRQKLNFKHKIYRSLMEVLDDSSNFPNDEGLLIVPPPIAKHLESATLGELRLMRELASLVQAAKVSTEVIEATNKIMVSPQNNLTASQQSTDREKPGSQQSTEQNRSSSFSILSPHKLMNANPQDSLGIPRHILQKAVQVTGTNGGTLLTHNGDKKRVYRIYPKSAITLSSAVERAVTPTANIPSTLCESTGTLYVTPPSKAFNLSDRKTPTPPLAAVRSTAIQYPKLSNNSPNTTNTNTSPMLPPSSNKSPALSNGGSAAHSTPQQKVTLNTHVPSANIFRRRYSICGPTPVKNSLGVTPLSSRTFTPSPLTKPLQSQPQTNWQQMARPQPQVQTRPQAPPPRLQPQLQSKPQLTQLQKQIQMKMMERNKLSQPIQAQRYQSPLPQQTPETNSRVLNGITISSNKTSAPIKLHISNPVSLNEAAQQKPFNNLVNFFDNDSSSSSSNFSPNKDNSTGLSDSNTDIPILETAGTIAADSFEPMDHKSFIKEEMTE